MVNSHDGWILYNYRSRVAVPVTRRHDPPHKLTRLNRGLVRLQEISDLITILHRPIKAKRSVVKEARSYGRINERVLNLMRGKWLKLNNWWNNSTSTRALCMRPPRGEKEVRLSDSFPTCYSDASLPFSKRPPLRLREICGPTLIAATGRRKKQSTSTTKKKGI